MQGTNTITFLTKGKNVLFSLIRFHTAPPAKMQFAKTQPV
jgi:hypothetical protein